MLYCRYRCRMGAGGIWQATRDWRREGAHYAVLQCEHHAVACAGVRPAMGALLLSSSNCTCSCTASRWCPMSLLDLVWHRSAWLCAVLRLTTDGSATPLPARCSTCNPCLVHTVRDADKLPWCSALDGTTVPYSRGLHTRPCVI